MKIFLNLWRSEMEKLDISVSNFMEVIYIKEDSRGCHVNNDTLTFPWLKWTQKHTQNRRNKWEVLNLAIKSKFLRPLSREIEISRSVDNRDILFSSFNMK